jgi:hypothetical protein
MSPLTKDKRRLALALFSLWLVLVVTMNYLHPGAAQGQQSEASAQAMECDDPSFLSFLQGLGYHCLGQRTETQSSRKSLFLGRCERRGHRVPIHLI